MWTVSEAKLFRRCQKQWYYKYRFAAALAKKVPARREAFVLSTFQTVEQWRGQLVDNVIEHVVVDALNRRRELHRYELLQAADAMFDQQLAFARANRVREPGMTKSAAGTNFAALLAVEEDGGLSDAEIANARTDVHRALSSLPQIPGLRDELRAARRVVAQNTFHFRFRDQPVGVVPDVVAFYDNRPPLVIDWKVHFYGLHDARVQLLIYALGLARSGKAGGSPERSWTETDIRTMEVQLLTGVARSFQLDEAAVAEMEEYIYRSMRAIARAGGGRDWDEIDPRELTGILSDEGCANCGFKPICWEKT